MTKCFTTYKIEYIFKQGTGSISLLHLRTRSNHLVFTFTSTDLVADALKVGSMVTRDTSKEHANLTCSESEGSEVADALNGLGRQQPR
jgi:hypothetical protein